MRKIAVLCVSRRSVYRELEGVEVYDAVRDVRTFAGGMPVVAHPPCRSWSAYCRHQAKPPAGEKELGPLCVEWLRQCGGVLEHPAHSLLFVECGLPTPPGRIGDVRTIEVKQRWWWPQMQTQKRTWLAFCGVDVDWLELPFCLDSPGDKRRWQVMSKTQRAATPRPFAEWLVAAARSAAT